MSDHRFCLLLLTLPVALTSCGLFGMSDEERNKLALFQENSARYYSAGRYPQALDQVRQGLEIDPGNYKLLATRAWILLRQVDAQPGLIGPCEQHFEELFAMRTPSRHGAPALLGQGEVQRRLGIEHWERAKVLDNKITNGNLSAADLAIAKAEAAEHQRESRRHFERARVALHALIDGELAQRDAHKKLMDIAATQNRYDDSVAHGLSCLEHGHREQEEMATLIKNTFEADEERAARVRMRELRAQELRVRSALAEMHYKKEDFDAALTQLDALIAMDSTRSSDYYNRAEVLQSMGRDADARADYQNFITSTKLPFGHEKVNRAHAFLAKAATPRATDRR